MNYKIFCETLIKNKTNLCCIITSCEFDDSPNSWYRDNKQYFIQNNMIFNEGISGCYGWEHKIRQLFSETINISVYHTWQMIDRNLSKVRFKPTDDGKWYDIYIDITNIMFGKLKIPFMLFNNKMQTIIEALKNLGIKEDVAKDIIKEYQNDINNNN